METDTRDKEGRIVGGADLAGGVLESESTSMPDLYLEQLLSTHPDDPATHGSILFLRAETRSEFKTLRTEIKTEFKAVRAEMAAEFKAVRAEMAAEFKAVRAEMAAEFKAVRAEMAAEFQAVREEMAAEFKAVRAEMHERFTQMDERLVRLEKSVETIAQQMLQLLNK